MPHRRLLKKLWAYRIRGNIHSRIKEFLSDRTQTIAIKGKESVIAKVTSGIPQGSDLGPILFVVSINDLPSAIQAMADVIQVQDSINNSEKWPEIWHVFFNFKNAIICTQDGSIWTKNIRWRRNKNRSHLRKWTVKRIGSHYRQTFKVHWTHKFYTKLLIGI